MAKYTGPEFEHCNRCLEPASEYVRFHGSGEEEALCYSHWHPIRRTCKVIHWINRYGRFMYAPGATTGPFRIKHP